MASLVPLQQPDPVIADLQRSQSMADLIRQAAGQSGIGDVLFGPRLNPNPPRGDIQFGQPDFVPQAAPTAPGLLSSNISEAEAQAPSIMDALLERIRGAQSKVSDALGGPRLNDANVLDVLNNPRLSNRAAISGLGRMFADEIDRRGLPGLTGTEVEVLAQEASRRAFERIFETGIDFAPEAQLTLTKLEFEKLVEAAQADRFKNMNSPGGVQPAQGNEKPLISPALPPLPPRRRPPPDTEGQKPLIAPPRNRNFRDA